MEKWGFGFSKKELIKENNISTPFKNGIPGYDYFIRFKKTFNLSQKKRESVEVARKRSIDPFSISPKRNPSRIKVVGEKDTAAQGPGKENMTVLMGGNAAKEKLPSLIVFKEKHVWDSWIPVKQEEYDGKT
ncbi:hypothetical protein ILUMI_08144 [Ignelater luminosus]|uniref:Uncharacterized protein n=1 Tax=Ignelater luminosus TaxID=2038154 RepID=A0A8K0D838_IGNLU|nr:hypothetical protein ILUMI_08144 [Ignelater luminosus]